MGSCQSLNSVSYVFVGHFLLLLFVVDCSSVIVQVKEVEFKSSLIGAKDNSSTNTVFDSLVVAQVNKKDDKVQNSKKIAQNVTVSEGKLNSELKIKEMENDKRGEQGFDSRKGKMVDGNKELAGSLRGVGKEKPRDEECDPSNMCIDEKKNLTACLRVTGNDSPELSLLIQNKGSRPVTTKILAPKLVQLEETKVQLQQKENKKVKVTLSYQGSDSLIVLVTEGSRCTLDFKYLIPRDSLLDSRHSFDRGYISTLTRAHWLILLSLCAFLVLGSVCMFWALRKKLLKNGYQTLEIELPVSGVPKPVSESDDNWDNSWEDNWDDETPQTPTLPTTPSLSSRRHVSRRLSKEGWKD